MHNACHATSGGRGHLALKTLRDRLTQARQVSDFSTEHMHVSSFWCFSLNMCGSRARFRFKHLAYLVPLSRSGFRACRTHWTGVHRLPSTCSSRHATRRRAPTLRPDSEGGGARRGRASAGQGTRCPRPVHLKRGVSHSRASSFIPYNRYRGPDRSV